MEDGEVKIEDGGSMMELAIFDPQSSILDSIRSKVN